MTAAAAGGGRDLTGCVPGVHHSVDGGTGGHTQPTVHRLGLCF